MVITVQPRSFAEAEKEIKLTKFFVKKRLNTKAAALKFFIKNGFITTEGKLTKRYGG